MNNKQTTTASGQNENPISVPVAMPEGMDGRERQLLPPKHPPNISDGPPIQGWGGLLEALLKNPNRLQSQLSGEQGGCLTRRLAVMAFLGMAAYGLVAGFFPGGMQLVAVPLKFAGGLLVSAAICWPSLYILLCLSGGQQSASEVTGQFASALALLAVLLAGFAPVVWIFAQSTHSPVFMGGLLVVLWMISCVFALLRLGNGLFCPNGQSMQALPVWSIVFIAVCMQMTATLRPILGPFKGWEFAARDFFLNVWFN